MQLFHANIIRFMLSYTKCNHALFFPCKTLEKLLIYNAENKLSSNTYFNYFSFTCSLPVPWFLYSVFNGFGPVAVSSNGLFCAIVLLFLMLLFVIISIAACRWKMNKILGLTMFALYFVFLIISVMLEDRIISCPVSVWHPDAPMCVSIHLKIKRGSR